MKRIILLILFLAFNGFSQDNQIIKDIRTQFKQWQPLLKENKIIPNIFYHQFTGDDYSDDQWLQAIQDSANSFIGEELSLYSVDSLGTVIKFSETSPSGDWFATSEHYYSKTGKLYFIFWTLNTFNAEYPCSIERRLYFNDEFEIIKKLESVYKMNTKEKIKNPNFMDIDIQIWNKIKDLPIYHLK